MTLETLVTELSAAGFDVSLNEAPDGTLCPYLVIEDVKHPNFGADNRVYAKTTNLILRLVESQIHDFALIARLENTLDALGLFYSSDDVSDKAEHVCETHYQISFFGGN